MNLTKKLMKLYKIDNNQKKLFESVNDFNLRVIENKNFIKQQIEIEKEKMKIERPIINEGGYEFIRASEFEKGDVIPNQKIHEVVNKFPTSYGEKTLIVLHDKKAIFLTKTSINKLIDGFGDETDNWINREIQLTVIEVLGKNTFNVEPVIVQDKPSKKKL